MDRTVHWGVCDTKDSCGSVLHSPRAGAALSSGGEREMMTGRALAGSTRSSLLMGTDVGRKMDGGYIVRRCSTDKATTKDEV